MVTRSYIILQLVTLDRAVVITLDWKISEKNPYNLYGSEKLITVLEYFVVRSSNKKYKYAKYYCAYIFARYR